MTAEITRSGINYIIHESGKGLNAKNGDTVVVNYTGRLLNGDVFDTSDEIVAQENNMFNSNRTYQPLSFLLGHGRVIKGWDEGIGLLNQGI